MGAMTRTEAIDEAVRRVVPVKEAPQPSYFIKDHAKILAMAWANPIRAEFERVLAEQRMM